MPEIRKGQRESLIDKALNRKSDVPDGPISLKRNSRIHESLIQFFLLVCGLLSILTTAGILVVLLQESLNFFNRDLWQDTNKPLSINIDANQTSFPAGVAGSELESGARIRIGQEEMLLETYTANDIHIEITGTTRGFELLCSGQADINNASREIDRDERASCNANGIQYDGYRIGTDAIVIAIHADNNFATDITLDELQSIFSDAENWSDVRPEWPVQPITRFIPGSASGTFDKFIEMVFDGVDETDAYSADWFRSEDDNQLVRGISNHEYAVGFFGYSYYLDNRETLTAVRLDGVLPSTESVADGSYRLTRPLFIYAGYSDGDVPENEQQIATFVDYYLDKVPTLISGTYFPVSPDDLNEGKRLLRARVNPALSNENTVIRFPDEIRTVSGDIEITGSSTVFPVTREIVDNYVSEGYQPQLTVIRGINGTLPVDHSRGSTIEIGDRVSLIEFFSGMKWQPAIHDFGIFPLVYGTLATSFIAMLVALPPGMGAAIYLSEYARENVRSSIKPILEILAGIPTVVYGYFALTFMTPLLQNIFGEAVQIYNSTSAGIVVGILIIPMVSSMSEDALRAVPQGLREASYGLGATKLETTVKVVIPAALSGIMAAFIVAVSRAIGETMIVAIAAGAGPQNNIPGLLGSRGPGILFEPAETMTGHIARISGGDLSYNSIDYNSIFAIGLLLFVLTFVLNLINNAIIRRFREAY